MDVRRTLALALVVPLLLAGCSEDEPTPKMPDPPPTSSPTPSPSASETPEAESAEDFIRRWAAIEAEMENTGDTSEYRELSGDCKACTDLAETIETYYGAGGFVEWQGWQIRSVASQPNSGSNAYVVQVRSSPTKYREASGSQLKSFEGGLSTHLLRLKKSGSSWLVVDKAELPR